MAFRSLLGLRHKPSVPDAPKDQNLGMRSPLVLAKIGNDLRQSYDDVLEAPLPEEIQRVMNQLPGTPTVLPFPRDPAAEV